MRVIYLNGPPGCGKDTVANEFRIILGEQMIHEKFANPIRAAIAGMGISPEEFDLIKNEPDQFHGMRWRDVAISFSEDWAKRKFGSGVFGEIAAMRIADAMTPTTSLVVVSDCGFKQELHTCEHALQDFAAKKHIEYHSMMMHIRRPGHTYRGDSREYVPPLAGMRHAEIENDVDEQTFLKRATSRARIWCQDT